MGDYSITDFGAQPDAETNNASFIQKAIDTCSAQGGGRVIIPAGGTFVSGTITLRSRVNLHWEQGACLRASPRAEDYLVEKVAGEYGGNEGAFLIRACSESHISLSGHGIIDGNAEAFLEGWWTEDGPYIRKPAPFRIRVIGLEDTQDLSIKEITIKHAPQWSCHLTGCRRVIIDGITILNGLDVPNCDGIDPDHCQDVRISNCHIEAGDDGIVIKTTREFMKYGPSENIVIQNCTLVSTSAAIKIGTESAQDIRYVTVSNCVIRRSHRGLAIQLRDEGNVSSILFNNCFVETRQFHPKWWGNAEAIYVTAVPRHPETKVGTISDVRFSQIHFEGENGILIYGTPEAPLKNIALHGISGKLRRTSKHPVNFLDLRPALSSEHGGLEECQPAPLQANHVVGLSLKDCCIDIPEAEEIPWTSEFRLEDVT